MILNIYNFILNGNNYTANLFLYAISTDAEEHEDGKHCLNNSNASCL